MEAKFMRKWCAAAAAAGCLGSAASAQESAYDFSRPVSLSGTAASEGVGLAPNVGAQLASCDGGCAPVCEPECSIAGWIGGSEVLLMKPYTDGVLFGEFGGLGGNGLNYNVGYRFWAGYQFEDGMSLRARFFNYSESGSSVPIFADPDETVNSRVTYFNTDLEIGDTFVRNDKWTVYGGLGLRYVDFRHRFSAFDGGVEEFNLDLDYYGIGPIGSLEVQRHLNDWLSVYGNFRAGALVGKYTISEFFDDESARLDASGFTFEAQIGLQAKRQLARGVAFGRFGWESQMIDMGSIETPAFQGAVFALGYNR